jgi:hypothetical protein
MLALETGWTPDVIASLRARFRAACHWALFIRAILPEGIPPEMPVNSRDANARFAAVKQRHAIDQLRQVIYPADE